MRSWDAAKVTLISAQQAAAYYDPEKSRGAYPTRDACLACIVDFTRREVDELIRLSWGPRSSPRGAQGDRLPMAGALN